jgi:hypothetical protein
MEQAIFVEHTPTRISSANLGIQDLDFWLPTANQRAQIYQPDKDTATAFNAHTT